MAAGRRRSVPWGGGQVRVPGCGDGKDLRPVYLLEGESHAVAAEVEAAIREACFPGGGDAAGYGRWDAGGLAQALAFLSTIPFLGEKRLAVVTLDPGGGEPEAIPQLEQYLADPPPWGVLVLRAPGRAPARLRSLCEKKGVVVPCHVERSDLPTWARDRARARGVRLTPAQAWLLVEMCGGEPDLVESELDKLSLALEPGRAVQEEDLRQHVFPGPAAPFSLADAWANRDLGRALAAVSRLLGEGVDPARLLATLAWQVRSLLLYSYLQAEGTRSPAEVARLMETSPAAVRATAARARGFSTGELESALLLLGEVDYRIKTGQWAPRQALEEFLFRTIRRKDRSTGLLH